MKKLSEVLHILFSLIPFPIVGGGLGFFLGGLLGILLGLLLGRFAFLLLLSGGIGGAVGGRQLAYYIARKREERAREEEVEVIGDITETLDGEHLIGLTVQIERPLPDVFTFVTDFDSYPQWHVATFAITPQQTTPAIVGSIYDHQLRGGDEFRAQFEITTFQPNKCLAFRYLNAADFNFQRISYEFAATETGTQITHIVELSPKERQPFLFSAHQMRIWRDLFHLKRLLEPIEVEESA